MKFGHKLQVKIDGYDKKGRGTAKAEIAPGIEREIAIPHSAEGDELECIFIKRDHAVKICEIEKIVAPGTDRVEPKCQHAGKCGGCIWQHLQYEAQLEEKIRGVKELFKRLNLEDKVLDAIPAEEILEYRNRMDFAVGWNGEIGLKETGSWNRYVDVKECHLLRPGAGQILQIVREWMLKHDLQPWDVKFHSGDVRYVVIRDGVETGERMVIVVVADVTRLTQQAKEDLVQKISPNPNTNPNPLSGASISTKPTSYPLSEAVETGYESFGDEALPDLLYMPHRKDLVDLARELRNNPTNSEQRIWDEVLSNKKTGYKFTQQKPLDGYIADFYCAELLLAIEIDGSSHDKRNEQDSARTEDLNKFAIKVLRYTNQQVDDDLESVKQDIENQLPLRKKELKNLNTSPLIRGFGGCATSLLIGEQSKPADLSYAQSFEALIGKSSITEIVNDTTYEIHPNSFFQTNTKMAARLQDVVLDAVRNAKTKKLLDLYCGLGFFGIAAAKKIGEIEEVVGYELDEEAVKLASQNMNVNEVGEKCRFFSSPTEALDWKDVAADTVILDPPRSGLHHKVIKTLLAEDSPTYPQTIIYVSCNYHRLEHELPSFMEKYEVTSIQPLDLFPQTRHVEVVVTLRLKTKDKE